MTKRKRTKPVPRRRIRKGKKTTASHQDVILLATFALKPYANNARTHSAKQIGQIKSSMKAFGFMNPILIDADNEVIAGHGRLAAALELGMATVPTIQVTHLSEKEVRAYRLADNKLAENATWDTDILQIEITELVDLEIGGELTFDLDAIGFETAELDLLISDCEPEAPKEIVEGPSEIAISRPGEIWILGVHRILCGSALEQSSYARLLGSGTAALFLTDPPYNVPVQGHVRGNGVVAHREFAMASGEMTSEEYTQFLTTSLGFAVGTTAPGTVVMVFIDWRHLRELDAATFALGLEQINLCIWVKNNGGMGSLYRSQHEICSVYKVPGGKHQNNVRLGSMGRYRTNVWNYAGVNTFGRNRKADLVDHPTVKPVAMIEDAIRDVTSHGDIVLDPFGGSGTTLLAAERCRRTARLIELDPAYVDVTIRRWQDLTGLDAIEEESGETWNDRAAEITRNATADEERSDV